MIYRVQVHETPAEALPLRGWRRIRGTNKQEAAVNAIRGRILEAGTLWAYVARPKPTWPNGSPCIVDRFELTLKKSTTYPPEGGR
ncbi:unnamed protein product [marine sediment metagenome]|uniref:Uncharacterized protein n=1 Tax=marine sediment metagenome TaxID=412755 RepID=X0VIW8_9ZZZZ